MNNRVFDLIVLLPITVVIICLVFFISLLIRHEIPKKTFIFLYKKIMTEDKADTKINKMFIKRIASQEALEIKKDMKLFKEVFSRKDINVKKNDARN